MSVTLDKGSRKNNFAELAFRFGSDLADPREQDHRNSELFRGFCERAISQRWAEAEMKKVNLFFASPKSVMERNERKADMERGWVTQVLSDAFCRQISQAKRIFFDQGRCWFTYRIPAV
jgi:hypothetical protein